MTKVQQQKWDLRFLRLARFVSEWSRDPSTAVGAAIVQPNKRIVSLGYNGFAQGVNDDPERYSDRELKYKLVVHAEVNAIHFANRDLAGCILYTWPFMPCARCAAQVIQVGITCVVAPEAPEDKRERWAEDMALSAMMFREAGVELVLYPAEEMAR